MNRRRLQRGFTQGAFAVLDQGLFSLGGMLLNILLARWLSPADYGAFAIGFAVLLYFLGFYNALVLEPMGVIGPSKYQAQLRSYLLSQLPLHFMVCAFMGIGIVATGLVIRIVYSVSLIDSVLITTGLILPWYSLGFLARRFFYVLHRPAGAVLVSILYSLVAVGCLVLVTQLIDSIGLQAGFWSMGLAGLSAGAFAVGWLLQYVDSSPMSTPLDWRTGFQDHWRFGRWLLASAVLGGIASQVQVIAVATLLGLEDVGAMRALSNLILPMQQVTTAIGTLGLSVLSYEFGQGNLTRLRSKALLITTGLSCLSFVYLVFLYLMGPWLDSILYEDRYANYIWLVPSLGMVPVVNAVATGLSLVTKATHKPHYSLIANFWFALIALVSAFVMTGYWGLGGLVASMILSSCFLILIYFRFYRLSLQSAMKVGA